MLTKNLLMALLLFFNLNLYAETITGRVVAVADGDTLTILDSNEKQHKVRLAGIDAPEKRQDFGNVSKKSLSELTFNKQVNVEYHKQDHYGRIVGKIRLEDKDINLEQIKRGMAWFFKKYQNELVLEDRLDYLHAEENAQKEGKGLWSDKEPVSPWDFRKKSKKEN